MVLGHDDNRPLVDAQINNPHLVSLGAYEMPRADYLARLADLAGRPGRPGSWSALPPLAAATLAGVSGG